MEHGITVVMTFSKPWLMHAANTLGELGIPVGLIGPSKDWTATRNKTLERIRQGKVRVLYLYAPFAATRDIMDAIKAAPGGLHRLVIGEIHLLSEVGSPCHPRSAM